VLSDLVKIDDVLFILKNNAAISEIKSNSLNIRQKEKWITIGDNEESIKSAKFVQEPKSERISFSIRFFDETGDRILAAFFTKMYDESKKLISERKNDFDQLNQKYASQIQF
jgi:putative heme iron utilization protein